MKSLAFLVVLSLVGSGCQSSDSASTANATAESTEASTPKVPVIEPATDSTQVGSATVKPGMDMADVKKLMGVPKDTKHEHGPNGSEIDMWIYEGQTVKFTDGKVTD